MRLIRDYRFRQWLYGVLSALLVVFVGYGLISPEQQENISEVIIAVLNLSGAAGLALASVKAETVSSDKRKKGKHVADADEL